MDQNTTKIIYGQKFKKKKKFVGQLQKVIDLSYVFTSTQFVIAQSK